MYFRLHNQNKIIEKAIKKAGSYRKLSKVIPIPRSTLVRYYNLSVIPEENFEKIIKFLEIKNPEKLIFKKLENNWKEILGGKNCVKSKKRKGTFEKQLKIAQMNGAKKFKEWHKKMKKTEPEKYYKMQYDHFKKIAGYKFKTKKGEKVRNLFEKQVADILYNLKIGYEYEPLVKSKNKYFFPDFLVNKKIIIECTAWKGKTKAYKLKEKVNFLEKDYRVYVVIPKSLYSYYKILNNHLILGSDEFVPVAQTFI